MIHWRDRIIAIGLFYSNFCSSFLSEIEIALARRLMYFTYFLVFLFSFRIVFDIDNTELKKKYVFHKKNNNIHI